MKKAKNLSILLIVIIIAVIWLLNGIYTLKSDGGEQAILTTLGKFVKTETEAGLKWHWPSPLGNVEIIKCDQLRSLEVGFRTENPGDSNSNSQFIDIPKESLMITGDENLVKIETVINYRITDPKSYLFKVDAPDQTLLIATESVIRRTVANKTLDEILTTEKELAQIDIRRDLQEICNTYGLGLQINEVQLQSVYAPEQVQAAFSDVVKAKEDKIRFVNEANKLSNEILPQARGNAEQKLNEARAYKERRIAEAQGDVAKFNAVYKKYVLGKDVTRTRMYLETMEEILPNAKLYFVDGSGGTTQFLPLESMFNITNNGGDR